MIGDVDDLFGKEAGINGVQHGTNARNPVIAFQMTVAVPGQGCDPVTQIDAQPAQGLGQLLGAMIGVIIGISMDRALHAARNDFHIAMILRRELD